MSSKDIMGRLDRHVLDHLVHGRDIAHSGDSSGSATSTRRRFPTGTARDEVIGPPAPETRPDPLCRSSPAERDHIVEDITGTHEDCMKVVSFPTYYGGFGNDLQGVVHAVLRSHSRLGTRVGYGWPRRRLGSGALRRETTEVGCNCAPRRPGRVARFRFRHRDRAGKSRSVR